MHYPKVLSSLPFQKLQRMFLGDQLFSEEKQRRSGSGVERRWGGEILGGEDKGETTVGMPYMKLIIIIIINIKNLLGI